MISANDLRIGNWIKLKETNAVVYQIFFDRRNGFSINHIDYKEEFFEPIPLTPEILEKTGFVFKDNYKRLRSGYWNNGINIEKHSDGTFYYSLQTAGIIIIKHLHQLQNLYYTLCGQELQISL